MGTEITAALGRARLSIMLAAVTYLSAVLIGAGLATAGNPTALAQRDAIVAGAQTGSVLTAMNRGDLTRAALLDFGSNLFLGAMPTTLAGLGVVFPFPIAAYRGWVGGIVSVDGRHVSRLVDPASALYYLVTMLLQLTGYVCRWPPACTLAWPCGGTARAGESPPQSSGTLPGSMRW
jgi:hypothetical protein